VSQANCISDVTVHSDRKLNRSWHPELFLEHLSATYEHDESAKGKSLQYYSAALLELSPDQRIGKNENNLIRTNDFDF